MLEADHCPVEAEKPLGSGVFSSERRAAHASDWFGEGCLPPDDCQAVLADVKERVERGEISPEDRVKFAERAAEYAKGFAIAGDVYQQICEVLKVREEADGFVTKE